MTLPTGAGGTGTGDPNQGTGAGGTGTPPEPAPTGTPPATPPAGGTGEPSGQGTGTGTPPSGGQDWEAIARAARQEAAAARVAHKKEIDDLKTNLGKALGVIPDDAKDPAALQAALAQRDQTDRAKDLEIHVLRSAARLGADPERLADSRTLMTALAALDHTAADHAAQVTALISKHVESNPHVKLATTTPGALPPGTPPPPVNDTSGAGQTPPPAGGIPGEAEGVDGMRRFLFGGAGKK